IILRPIFETRSGGLRSLRAQKWNACDRLIFAAVASDKNDTRESDTGEETRPLEEARFRAFAGASGRNCAKAGERQPFAGRGHETVRRGRPTLPRLPETSGTGRRQSGAFAQEGWRRIGCGAVRSRGRGTILAGRGQNAPPGESAT